MEVALVSGVNGIVLSAIYIMVALGFALLLSIMGIFNFAHGAIYMIGAYVTYGLAQSAGLNQWAALLLSMIIMGAFGIFLEKFCLRPFSGNANGVIVMSIALVLILETGVIISPVGGSTRALPAFVPGDIKFLGVSVTRDRLITLTICVILLIIMTFFIQRTKMGQQMLAVSQDREGAALQGININRTAAIAMVIACILAALSGSLMSSLLVLDPFMGDNMLMKAIEVVILSGIGSIGGILAGGLIVGLMDAILPLVLPNPLIAQAITIGVIILILLIRPKGLFGYELL